MELFHFSAVRLAALRCEHRGHWVPWFVRVTKFFKRLLRELMMKKLQDVGFRKSVLALATVACCSFFSQGAVARSVAGAPASSMGVSSDSAASSSSRPVPSNASSASAEQRQASFVMPPADARSASPFRAPVAASSSSAVPVAANSSAPSAGLAASSVPVAPPPSANYAASSAGLAASSVPMAPPLAAQHSSPVAAGSEQASGRASSDSSAGSSGKRPVGRLDMRQFKEVTDVLERMHREKSASGDAGAGRAGSPTVAVGGSEAPPAPPLVASEVPPAPPLVGGEAPPAPPLVANVVPPATELDASPVSSTGSSNAPRTKTVASGPSRRRARTSASGLPSTEAAARPVAGAAADGVAAGAAPVQATALPPTHVALGKHGRMRVVDGVANEKQASLVVTNAAGNTHGIVVQEHKLTLSGGEHSTNLRLDDRGATFGDADTGAPVVISGVASGVAPNDAANVGQVREVVDAAVAPMNERIGDLGNQVRQLDQKIDAVEKKLSGGVAMAMALSQPVSFAPQAKSAVTGGIATYNGQNAMGFSYNQLLHNTQNQRTVVSLGVAATLSGKARGSARAGVSFSW